MPESNPSDSSDNGFRAQPGDAAASAGDTRVVIVDADPLARAAARDAVAAAPGLTVAGEAASGEAALQVCSGVDPEIVVIELDVTADRARRLIAALCAMPDAPRVLPFTQLTGDQVLIDALRAGASGFVAKEGGTEALVASLQALKRGEVAISRVDTMRIIEVLRRSRRRNSGMRPIRSTLTAREWEIFDLMAGGDSTRTMAEKLVLSEATVYSHVKSILRKLGVHSRAEAVKAVEAMSRPATERRQG